MAPVYAPLVLVFQKFGRFYMEAILNSSLNSNSNSNSDAKFLNHSHVPAAFYNVMRVLLVLIVLLMALGAGVRTMNAGLSCPDWPLCFGKVIPEFHVGVWFEFVHRAYAGLVSLLFLGTAVYAIWSPVLPRAVKVAAVCGIGALMMQIVMGALTVLLLVKAVIVTGHLICATLFYMSVLAMYFYAKPNIVRNDKAAPVILSRSTGFFAVATFLQLVVGGFVASTYAGSVCVDWPLCNGVWVPTWRGAIGLQITHRFIAYFLTVSLLAYAIVIQTLQKREAKTWMTHQILLLSRVSAGLVILQMGVGIANLLFYIPPSVTVLHQTMAIVLLTVNLRAYFVARELAQPSAVGALA